jgi:hypothetical protein
MPPSGTAESKWTGGPPTLGSLEKNNYLIYVILCFALQPNVYGMELKKLMSKFGNVVTRKDCFPKKDITLFVCEYENTKDST